MFVLPGVAEGAGNGRTWLRWIPDEIEVVSFRYPGRENRLNQPRYGSFDEVIEAVVASALAEASPVPTAVYGRCWGGVSAYEVARALEQADWPHLRGVVTRNIAAPASRRNVQPQGVEDDLDVLIGRLAQAGETNASLFALPQVRQILGPILRADARMVDAYSMRPGAVLASPLHAVQPRGWSTRPDCTPQLWAESTKGRFSLDFVDVHGDELQAQLGELLTQVTMLTTKD